MLSSVSMSILTHVRTHREKGVHLRGAASITTSSVNWFMTARTWLSRSCTLMHSAPMRSRSRLRASVQRREVKSFRCVNPPLLGEEGTLNRGSTGRNIRGCCPLLTMISRDPGKHHYFKLYLRTDIQMYVCTHRAQLERIPPSTNISAIRTPLLSGYR